VLDFGPLVLAGSPATEESPVSYCPRRTVLDKVLIDGAAAAGVEVREGFGVDELVEDGGRVTGIRGHATGGSTMTEEARIVIGADGLKSFVARSVNADQYHERPRQLCGYYSYWSNLPVEGRFETYVRDDRGFAAAPTNDGLTLVVGGWPYSQFDEHKGSIEAEYLAMFERAPAFAERLRDATRETRVVGTAVPNFFRKPYGEGWALVGDAGYNKDFITAQGISDAFRDAELCADALDQALSGNRDFEDAMDEYQRRRDEHVMAMYEFTVQLASLEPPPPELMQVLAALPGNQEALDQFVRVNAGALSPAEFFAEDNVGRILATAGA
jgi:flavin-dependent dehydrogenase